MREHRWYFKIMHWLVAGLILAAFVMAWIFEDMKFSPEKLQLINYHKWIGFSVLILFIPRLLSSIKGYAALPVENIQDKGAKAIHHLLYLCMFITPLLGWLMSSAKGFQIVLFGVLPIPDLLEKNKELGHTLSEAHEISATILLICIGLHIGGALFRQFVKKDKIISKMI